MKEKPHTRRDPVLLLNRLIRESYNQFPYLGLRERSELFEQDYEIILRGIIPPKRKPNQGRKAIYCDIHGLRFAVAGQCASCYANELRAIQRTGTDSA